ncbi:MAG: RNA chaperone Hfq [Oscillospiraceae bacterium]|nr:RNA chaperone Hfq [Oscillospiraceae bacterium]
MPMAAIDNLQDLFLNDVRKEHQLVTVFLMNGFQMKGVITGFDSFVVCLVTEGRQQMIYKHAISTVVPARPVKLAP